MLGGKQATLQVKDELNSKLHTKTRGGDLIQTVKPSRSFTLLTLIQTEGQPETIQTWSKGKRGTYFPKSMRGGENGGKRNRLKEDADTKSQFLQIRRKCLLSP
ncbi:MAG: hypothetical protein AAGA30_16395, partial [Planctomycetota bacterium]